MKNENEFHTFLEKVWQRLSEIRHRKNEKIESVSKGINMAKSAISQIEHGRYDQLRIHHLAKFADYYGISLYELISLPE